MSPRFRTAVFLAVTLIATLAPATGAKVASVQDRLADLEHTSGGRLGVAAIDTGSGKTVMYRATERFPLCSTFKVMLAAAVLKRSEADPALLARRIPYKKADLVTYSPITGKHVGAGMPVAALCAATLQYSDNTAANVLIDMLGGTRAVTAFARSIGDARFRLDRKETNLNNVPAGDVRDTTTPAAMAESLKRLTLGDALSAAGRDRLTNWMRGNTTGAARIRAGMPAGWPVADKTGTGYYGTTNDIGVVWPPHKPPIVLAIYFTRPQKMAATRDDVVARAARLVGAELSK